MSRIDCGDSGGGVPWRMRVVEALEDRQQARVRRLALEDQPVEAARRAGQRLPRAAVRREQHAEAGARADQPHHAAGDVVGAVRAVGGDDVLVLLDRPAVQRDEEHAGRLAETHQRVDVAAGAHVEAGDGDRVAAAGAGAQLRDQRIDGVRKDVLGLVDRRDRAAGGAEREVALDVDDVADRVQRLEHRQRRPLEQVPDARRRPAARAPPRRRRSPPRRRGSA